MNNLPTSEKPREKLLKKGASTLSTAEILAIILRTGTKERSALELALDLLALDSRGLRHLLECTPEELCVVKGMGTAKVCEVLAAIELGKRISSLPPEDRPSITSSQDIANRFMERLRHEKKEHFICLLMNSRGEIIEERNVSIGDLNSSVCHPREVFLHAVKRSAGSVAFVHNHPSGNPMPSSEDISTTKRLVEAGELLGIPVIDHVIIGDMTYTSLKALDIIN